MPWLPRRRHCASSSTTGSTTTIETIVPPRANATAVATIVPTAMAASCCRPCASDRYTVDSTSTTAIHGATNATGACNHHPATAHARQAASAALLACIVRSRSRPGPLHTRRTASTGPPA